MLKSERACSVAAPAEQTMKIGHNSQSCLVGTLGNV